MIPIKSSDLPALNTAFAEKVAGLSGLRQSTRWEVTDPPSPPVVLIGIDSGYNKVEVPNFCGSADAVLPWLEKSGAWAMDWCPIISNRDAAYKVWLRKRGIEAIGPTLPRAAVIALLRAHGVTVIDFQ